MNALQGMAQDLWNSFSDAKRAELRDLSGLSSQLAGLEGWRVEVITMDGAKRRFIVGRSTGWRPCSLEISRRTAHGGGCAEKEYRSVRKLYKVR